MTSLIFSFGYGDSDGWKASRLICLSNKSLVLESLFIDFFSLPILHLIYIYIYISHFLDVWCFVNAAIIDVDGFLL